MSKTFTIEEIRYYLEGCKVLTDIGFGQKSDRILQNSSLNNAIHELEDPEDGIEAVSERKKEFDTRNDETTNWN